MLQGGGALGLGQPREARFSKAALGLVSARSLLAFAAMEPDTQRDVERRKVAERIIETAGELESLLNSGKPSKPLPPPERSFWKMPKTPGNLLSLLLCSMLASCSTTPHTHAGGLDLAHSVLLIQELPDGQVTHRWQRAEDVDLSQYRGMASVRAATRTVVLAAAWLRDCDEENDECLRKCMNRPLAPGYGHITSGGRKKGGKEAFCRKECQQAFDDCRELEKTKPHEFTAIDSAVDWLKRNHKAILAGSVVIIAGAVFVVVSAGAGLVILAPAALLAVPGAESPSYVAGTSP